MDTTALPKRMSKEARREFLLEAAERVLHSHALAELSFELIADEAGVSKTLPYSYFESSAEIATLLFERTIGGVDSASEALVASDIGFDDKLRGSLHLWCDTIKADGLLVQALLNGRAMPAIRPLLDARDRRAEQMWAKAMAEEFDLADVDAQFMGVVMTSSSSAALQHWAHKGGRRHTVIDRLARATRAMATEFSRS